MSKENKAICSVCLKDIEDKKNAPILTMGHYGYPRLLCKDCDDLVSTALRSRDVTEAEAAMARLGETVGNYSADDTAVLETVEQIFKTATERIEKIKDGTYDFALDDEEEVGAFDEIPEELLETEEDKRKTEKEEESNRKFNKIMDIITAVVFVAAAVVILYIIFGK